MILSHDPFCVSLYERRKVCLDSYFFGCGCPSVPALFVKNTLNPPMNCTCSFVTEQWAACVRVCVWLCVYTVCVCAALHAGLRVCSSACSSACVRICVRLCVCVGLCAGLRVVDLHVCGSACVRVRVWVCVRAALRAGFCSRLTGLCVCSLANAAPCAWPWQVLKSGH